MTAPGGTEERQLTRQAEWLKASWLWVLDTVVLPSCRSLRPSALDVGAGSGVVAEALSSRMDIVALDLDRGCVERARERGLNAVEGDAYALPYGDESFDIVYCSFLFLWLKEPELALKEMARVSRQWVICLAEPDHAGRIDHPEELAALSELVCDGIRREGGDPKMGRKLSALFSNCGLTPELGIHPGVWSIERLRAEADPEWSWIAGTAGPRAEELKPSWDAALMDGSLFQFNPIFYALARK